MSSKFAISLLGLTVAAAVAAVGTSVYTARKLDEQIKKQSNKSIPAMWCVPAGI